MRANCPLQYRALSISRRGVAVKTRPAFHRCQSRDNFLPQRRQGTKFLQISLCLCVLVVKFCLMNLSTAFADCAQKHAQKTAIFYGEREISYAELHAQSLKVAEHLRMKLHVEPGDRVALWLKNCPEFVTSVFGILGAGAVVVPVNNFLKSAEVIYILNDSAIDLVITDAELGAQFETLKSTRPALQLFQVEDFSVLPPSPLTPSAVSRTEKELAVIIYTSGTTGKP